MLALVFALLLQSGHTVALQWDPNTETDLAGYKVYWGSAPRVYGPPRVVGLAPEAWVSPLAAGRWYFAVTAFNTAGLESDFSNEVTATINPDAPTLTIGPIALKGGKDETTIRVAFASPVRGGGASQDNQSNDR